MALTVQEVISMLDYTLTVQEVISMLDDTYEDNIIIPKTTYDLTLRSRRMYFSGEGN